MLGRAVGVRDGVANVHVGHLLDAGDDVADLAGRQLGHGGRLGEILADLGHLVRAAGGHQHDRVALLDHAIHQPHVADHAAMHIGLGVVDQRRQRSGRVAAGRRDALDNGGEHLVDALAGLAGGEDGVGCVQPEHLPSRNWKLETGN